MSSRTRRLWLWGLVVSPLLLCLLAFAAARAWLNHHLQSEINLVLAKIRLANPDLGWDLRFAADSVQVETRALSLSAGAVAADLSLWQSLVSFRPSLSGAADTVRIRLRADTSEERRRRKRKKTPVFPNPRIPIPFHLRAGVLIAARGDTALCTLKAVRAYSQGPKGASLEWEAMSLRPGGRRARDSAAASAAPRAGSIPDSAGSPAMASLTAAVRLSARWFGKSIRYQVRAGTESGDFVWLEGERRKSDLRVGRDSLEIGLAGLTAYAALWPGLPDLRDVRVELSNRGRPLEAARGRARFKAPAFWQLGPQDVDLRADWEDSSGRAVLDARGRGDAHVYLQGQFRLPGAPGDSGMLEGLSASLAGFTRNHTLRFGRFILPADMEIKRLRIQPGLIAEAEIRTRDSSVLEGRAQRDTLRSGPRKGIPSWKLAFSGTVHPREAWAHRWTRDTNVTFREGWVEGEFRPGEVVVKARLKGPVTAYGALADSVTTVNAVTKRGYYLRSAVVHGKRAAWAVKGQVEWGKRSGTAPRRVSLGFDARHPRHGALRFVMPQRRRMQLQAQNFVAEYFPYAKAERVLATHPWVNGDFEWDWEERRGSADVRAGLAYQGERFEMAVRGSWDAILLRVASLEVSGSGSDLRLSADLRLRGRQFHQLRQLRLEDVQGISLVTARMDAARIAALAPKLPLAGGVLNGRLSYDDTTGFGGVLSAAGVAFRGLRDGPTVSSLSVVGGGRTLNVAAVTHSPSEPWLDDTVSLRVDDVLGERPGLVLKVRASQGPVLSFSGSTRRFRDLAGRFDLSGHAVLPGGAGILKDLRAGGALAARLDGSFLASLRVDSAFLRGRYGAPGVDTQAFTGDWRIAQGRLVLERFRAVDPLGRSLDGEGECRLVPSVFARFRLRGQALALRLPDVQKLLFQDLEATLRADSLGLSLEARAGRASFQAAKSPWKARGDLEGASFAYRSSPARVASPGAAPDVRVKARLRNFLFQHKLGFREIQRYFRTVKVDKRKKRIKPMDLQLDLETAGTANRIETGILRMNFIGDIAVRGVYPYTMISGQVSSVSGELGQSSQSYALTDMGIKWQNATVEEGRVNVEAVKKLRADCKPVEANETKRMCHVFIKLDGRLDDMGFTYDSDCGGGSAGEAIKPTSLINSVSRGCFFEEDIAGSGGGNYGEAVFNFLEPAINERLTRAGSKFTYGWIQTTQVTGIGTAISGDTTGAQPIAVNVETKEKWGIRGRAKAGYHQEKKLLNPWETRAALEWRPPLERVAKDSTWKRRVRDRVTLEASVETRPEENAAEDEDRVRQQVGIRYRYKFWDLW